MYSNKNTEVFSCGMRIKVSSPLRPFYLVILEEEKLILK